MQILVLLALVAVLVLSGVAVVAIRRLKAKTRAIQSDLAEVRRAREAVRASSRQAHKRFQRLLRRWRGRRLHGNGGADDMPK